jgi:hypothetical protein
MSDTASSNQPQTITESGDPAQEEVLKARGLSREEWAAHVERVKEAWGKFAWVRTSSEEFSRRKQEEIELEEERSRRRMR